MIFSRIPGSCVISPKHFAGLMRAVRVPVSPAFAVLGQAQVCYQMVNHGAERFGFGNLFAGFGLVRRGGTVYVPLMINLQQNR